LPTTLPEELSITAICEREDARDALVLRSGIAAQSILDLPEGAVVGTSSQRRLAQLKALRGDVVVNDLRGNVDTRIRKLDEGHYDAVILACAGLLRLGLENRISARVPTHEMLPAVGQGAIAIEVRSDNKLAVETTGKLDHRETRLACLAERSFLRALGGGCELPIAAHAILDRDQLVMDGLIAKPDGSEILRDSISGSPNKGEELGATLALRLIERGGTLS
jgi:hydroxymethylbilane synthase